MCCANDVMAVQTSQLGQIKNLEDQVYILTNKVMEQDQVITNLVSNNLDHLQANMWLTSHINSSNAKVSMLEHCLEDLEEMFLAEMGWSSSEAGI